MPEVKRYWVHWNDQLYVADKNGDLVMSDDFDRVTAERDGLQISLNTADQSIDDLNAAISRRTHRVRELEALLTAADERSDVLGGLLFSLPEDLKDLSGSENTAGVYACIDYIEQCIAGLQPVSALKPALVTNDEHVCSGCGSKGWTANCAKCVPY